ncbi:PilZ domain-containing protein [Frigidibacter sp. ROC022]|uniref:PilZ domain-containing protein n=1 Tax=Frigidibacter sp. ROC022 TaxID=2971796 RepID=UPI00215A7B18|nr:PilZ domain-containing protein [Frigidibacter sp. ROC022]MCR8723294.1 PilZ domain-containing protein [Frigidibacter sp. ROC022]
MSFMSTRLDADPRRYRRQKISLLSELAAPDGETFQVRTIECSGGGARIIFEDADGDALQGEGWLLTIPRLGCYEVQMKWRRDSTYGVRFVMPVAEQDHLAARLALIAPRLQQAEPQRDRTGRAAPGPLPGPLRPTAAKSPR